jgi:carbonic anhydrase
MQKLVEGVHHFQSQVFNPKKALFEWLSRGQNPVALFITCSDSRIDPNLITQTEPGDLFVIRNAGNIVPPYGADHGEPASIEYAVNALGIQDIVVCGHSHCGAMAALLEPGHLKDLPAVSKWLGHAEPTRRLVAEKYGHLQGEALLMATVEENVLSQLEQVACHPAVADKLVRGDVKLHGWVYKIETGEVFTFDPAQGQFVLLRETGPLPSSPVAAKQTSP